MGQQAGGSHNSPGTVDPEQTPGTTIVWATQGPLWPVLTSAAFRSIRKIRSGELPQRLQVLLAVPGLWVTLTRAEITWDMTSPVIC